MSKVFDVVYFTGRKYTDKDGVEREDSVRMGAVIKNKNGNNTLILDSIPVGFTGMASLFEPKPREGQAAAPAKQAPVRQDIQDDDIPF